MKPKLQLLVVALEKFEITEDSVGLDYFSLFLCYLSLEVTILWTLSQNVDPKSSEKSALDLWTVCLRSMQKRTQKFDFYELHDFTPNWSKPCDWRKRTRVETLTEIFSVKRG